MTEPRSTRFAFPRRLRLVHTRQFDAVYAAQVKAAAGPLVVWARPNDLDHCRLGLSIARRVGSAAVRNRVKRMIRESFRLTEAELPRGYDLVVSVRRHEPRRLGEYRAALAEAAGKVDRIWTTRTGKDG